MAKITIAGDAVVVTSTVKFEDLKTVEKYYPEALVLMGGEDGKEQVFKVGTTTGKGNLNRYGAEFGSATRDDRALATMTLPVPETEGEDVKETVAETIGAYLMDLNEVEESIPAALAAIAAKKQAIMANITIAE